jgi:hypothetical protein
MSPIGDAGKAPQANVSLTRQSKISLGIEEYSRGSPGEA